MIHHTLGFPKFQGTCSRLPFLSCFLIIGVALALPMAGCSKGQKEVDSTLGEAPSAKVQENMEKREAEFQKNLASRSKSPVQQPGVLEPSAPEAGFGKKTDAEIKKERERSMRIAVLGPFTGELEFYGKEASDGAELASDEINDRGGIKKQKYDLLVYDTRGSMDGTRAGVAKFLDQNVVAVVGAATGEVSFSATKTLNDNQLIMFSAGSRRRLGDSGPYNFRNTLDDNQGIKRLVEYLAKEKKWKNFALFTSLVNDYSIKLTAAFKGEIEKQNGKMVQELYLWSQEMTNIQADETSIPAQLKKLKGNIPDALIYTGEGKEAAELVTEMRKLGINIPIVGCEDLMVPEFTSLAKQADGTVIYGGFNVNSNNPRVKKFVADFTKRFKRPPTRLSALAYDAYYMIAEAIEKAPSLRPSHVQQSLTNLKDFHGVTGTISMGSNREALKEPFIFEFGKKDGKYEFNSVKEPL